MKFFKLDNSDESNSIAPILSKKFNCSDEPRAFNSKAFKEMDEQDLERMAFLGHSDKKSIGDYTTTKFVSAFSAAFGTKRNKECVQDIYIVGCETALQHTNEKCFAQLVADQLYAKGFKKVCVHAIASPKHTEAAGMRIHVVTQVGANSFTRNIGDVYAYTLTHEQEKRMDAAEKIIATLTPWHTAWQKRDKNIRSHTEVATDKTKLEQYNQAASVILYIGLDEATLLLNTGDIKGELDKSKNSFYPSSVKPEAAYDEEKEKIIQAVEKHAYHLQIQGNAAQDAGDLQRKTNKDNHKKTLEALSEAIAKCATKKEWDNAIEGCINKHYSGVKQSLLATSGTRIFLMELKRGKIPVDHPSSAEDKDIEPKKITPKPSLKAAKVAQQQNIQLVIAVNKLRELAGLLLKEDARKTSLFGISYSFMKTKVIKSRKLIALADALDAHCQAGKALGDKDCQAILLAAKSDKKLTQSIISARTLNLLDNIIAGDPGNGVEIPDPNRNPKLPLPIEPPVIKRWY